ncbi:replication protein A 70 kDa DNA-binding subunit B [Brachypodium distachyon]|uniref:replication protein A 70 kDa DNA-binding subunit B n=1 Tax=Brachypodium distachyon TaxID=15368 RepID=UPI00052FF477|nr:replication protein A 70 kDa DNA-binding subunit B [Brachypodium distachyon]|eukprot:XP_014758671.2 replication protein A 70 kDa DNA-binding subunit B [Brachypodium distachyon]
MAGLPYSLLEDVTGDRQDWRVRVRVARIWNQWSMDRPDDLLRIHLVLADEKGEGIHGIIAKPWLSKFAEVLKEGRVYYLQYFEVTPARDWFRPVLHRFEIRLAKWSTVTEVSPMPDDFPLHTYKLRTFQNLLDNMGDKMFLADVVGIVTGVSPLISVDVKGRQVSKRVVRLTDTRQTAILALWDENAEHLDADALVDSSLREPVIALVMGCTYKIEDSMLSLSASYGSKICINIANPGIVFLRNRAGSVQYTIEWIVDKGQGFSVVEVEKSDVESLGSMIPHVAAVLNMPFVLVLFGVLYVVFRRSLCWLLQNRKFRCYIVIKELVHDQNWWFLSCDTCTYKATEEGDAYKCTNSACGSTSASPRYKLIVVAAEKESTVEMVFFGDVARDLIGKPAIDLVATSHETAFAVPKELLDLVGRKYIVDVAVSRYSFRMDHISFQVLKFYPEGGSVYVDFVASCATGSGLSPGSSLLSADKLTPVAPSAGVVGQHAGETSSVSGAEDLIDPLIIGDEDVGDDAADDSFMPPRDVLDQSRLPDLNGLSKKAGSNMKGASADKRKDKSCDLLTGSDPGCPGRMHPRSCSRSKKVSMNLSSCSGTAPSHDCGCSSLLAWLWLLLRLRLDGEMGRPLL